MPAVGVPPSAVANNPFIIGLPPSSVVLPAPPAPPAESIADIESTRVSTRRKAASSWQLVMSDGQRQTAAGAVLIGRDPAADPRWPGAVLIAVVDTTKTVSKTHALLELDADSLWVTDLQSSNGVLIEDPDGREAEAEPGVRTAAQAGSEILLGDFVVRIERV